MALQEQYNITTPPYFEQTICEGVEEFVLSYLTRLAGGLLL